MAAPPLLSCLNMARNPSAWNHDNIMIVDELDLPEPLKTEIYYPKHVAYLGRVVRKAGEQDRRADVDWTSGWMGGVGSLRGSTSVAHA